jgi:hypothetical protein
MKKAPAFAGAFYFKRDRRGNRSWKVIENERKKEREKG